MRNNKARSRRRGYSGRKSRKKYHKVQFGGIRLS